MFLMLIDNSPQEVALGDLRPQECLRATQLFDILRSVEKRGPHRLTPLEEHILRDFGYVSSRGATSLGTDIEDANRRVESLEEDLEKAKSKFITTRFSVSHAQTDNNTWRSWFGSDHSLNQGITPLTQAWISLKNAHHRRTAAQVDRLTLQSYVVKPKSEEAYAFTPRFLVDLAIMTAELSHRSQAKASEYKQELDAARESLSRISHDFYLKRSLISRKGVSNPIEAEYLSVSVSTPRLSGTSEDSLNAIESALKPQKHYKKSLRPLALQLAASIGEHLAEPEGREILQTASRTFASKNLEHYHLYDKIAFVMFETIFQKQTSLTLKEARGLFSKHTKQVLRLAKTLEAYGWRHNSGLRLYVAARLVQQGASWSDVRAIKKYRKLIGNLTELTLDSESSWFYAYLLVSAFNGPNQNLSRRNFVRRLKPVAKNIDKKDLPLLVLSASVPFQSPIRTITFSKELSRELAAKNRFYLPKLVAMCTVLEAASPDSDLSYLKISQDFSVLEKYLERKKQLGLGKSWNHFS